MSVVSVSKNKKYILVQFYPWCNFVILNIFECSVGAPDFFAPPPPPPTNNLLICSDAIMKDIKAFVGVRVQ